MKTFFRRQRLPNSTLDVIQGEVIKDYMLFTLASHMYT